MFSQKKETALVSVFLLSINVCGEKNLTKRKKAFSSEEKVAK
jgi:hypothetical protein